MPYIHVHVDIHDCMCVVQECKGAPWDSPQLKFPSSSHSPTQSVIKISDFYSTLGVINDITAVSLMTSLQCHDDITAASLANPILEHNKLGFKSSSKHMPHVQTSIPYMHMSVCGQHTCMYMYCTLTVHIRCVYTRAHKSEGGSKSV